MSLFTINTYSQQGYKAVYLMGGYTLQNGGNAKIGLDIPISESSIDLYAQYYKNSIEKNYIVGLLYKGSIYRGITSSIKFGGGIGVGTTTHKFIFAPTLVLEYVYSISPVVDIACQVDGGYYSKTMKDWRVNTYLGLRFNF